MFCGSSSVFTMLENIPIYMTMNIYWLNNCCNLSPCQECYDIKDKPVFSGRITIFVSPEIISLNSLHAGYFFMLLLSYTAFFQN